MIAFEWVEKNPVVSFVCALLVLTYIYGVCWTIVILFTLYLIDEALKDTEEEKIYGKQLLNVSTRIVNPFDNPSSPVVSLNKNMFPNHKKQNIEKKPSLQELVNLKRTTSRDNTIRHDRQPLAAIVKNNMNIQFSNAELEKRKPLYQSLRTGSPMSTYVSRNASPSIDKSLYNGSPSLNKSNLNSSPSLNRTNLNGGISLNRSSFIGSPSLNRTNLNTSVNMTVNTSVASPLNDSLEVHGSYFINKSVLHSPAAERTASPSSIPFQKNIKTSVSNFPVKCSAESVVEALKQKSKRKRVAADTSDEATMKKKKTDDIDSTLNDLLPNNDISMVEQVLSSKRKNISDKEVMSTGVQCEINSEEAVTKKKKVNTEKVNKYGLSQKQIDELSGDTTSSGHTEDDDQSLNEEIAKDEKGSVKKLTLKDSIKNIAHDCSFKTVSFADNTPDKTVDKKKEESISKPSSKLSALRNMESPYKRLFDKAGPMKNITPESVKKMRKHPVYFTAKINIDEIQQHREEFGESGVSLKAFRLDKEEAVKRIDSLFDETDGDIDFKLKSVTTMVTTSTLTITSTVSDVKANLFGTSAASSITTSSTAISTSSFSFGGVTALTSIAAPVSSVSLVSSISTTTVLPLLLKSSTVSTTEVSATVSIASTVVSLATTNLLTSTLTGSTPSTVATSSLTEVKDSVPALPSLTSTSSNFSFGLGAAATASNAVPPPALSFPILSKPVALTSTSVLPTLGTLPTLTAISTSATSQFNFSFKPQPAQTTQSNQISVVSTAPAPALATGSFSFGAPSATSLSKDPTTAISSVSSGFSFAPASVTNVPSAASVPNSNLFGGAQLSSSTFGTSASSAISQPSLFGSSSAAALTTTTTAATFQTSLFGNTSVSTALPSQASVFGTTTSNGIFNQPQTSTTVAPASVSDNIFAQQKQVNGFSFTSTAAAPTGFSFSTTTTSATSSSFSFTANTTTASSGGFSFTTSSAVPSGFSFGSSVSSTANVFSVSSVPASQSNIFGQTAPAASNSQPTQNIFGAPAVASSASSQNIFGAAPSSTQSIFGAPASSAPTSQSIFGNSTQNAFGSTNQNAFGSTGQNVFGAAPQPSIFGDQSKASTGFTFGATAASTAASGGFAFGASTTTTNSVFGQSNNVFGNSTATNNAGVFGAAKPAENPFGQQPKPSGGFDFSSSLSAAPTINFGGATAPTGNAFNAQKPNEIPKPSFNFGSQPATPTFGATPASPAFGNIQQPAFGSPQPFGTPSMNPAGGGFTIGSGTSNPPPTRQTQRARRRLRR